MLTIFLDRAICQSGRGKHSRWHRVDFRLGSYTHLSALVFVVCSGATAQSGKPGCIAELGIEKLLVGVCSSRGEMLIIDDASPHGGEREEDAYDREDVSNDFRKDIPELKSCKDGWKNTSVKLYYCRQWTHTWNKHSL